MGDWPVLTPRVPPKRFVTEDRRVRKDVVSANWDGGGDLSGGKDTTATEGYLVDYGSGSAQYQEIFAEGGDLGDLDVSGDIVLTDGGSIYTSPTAPRIRLFSDDKDRIWFYTGDVDENKAGILQLVTTGSGTARYPQIYMYPPVIETNTDRPYISVSSESPDGTTRRPGVYAGIAVQGSGSGQTPRFYIGDGMELDVSSREWVGNLNLQGDKIYFDADVDTNTYIESYEAGNQFKFVIDGTTRLRIGTSGNMTLNGTRIYMGSDTGNDFFEFTGTWRWYDDGVEVMHVSGAAFTADAIYSSTTGNVANVYVDSAGRLYRSTA